ncbi:MAG: HEAT repeat domain-containing protein [Deltaproteobacteria bacterium]|nr:HEAT repeat domain-containing protein [Deltaproteobacteria bacterium]
MSEQLLEFSIYFLSFLIGVLLIWAILRELLTNFKEAKDKGRHQEIKKLLEGWMKASSNEAHEAKKQALEKLKQLGSPSYLEPFFFELFEKSESKDQKQLKILFELLGIQEELRFCLKESPNVIKREHAVLKLGKVGVVEDVPFLLDVFNDPEEDSKVKQCCVESIYMLAEPLLKAETAHANLGLLIKLFEVPNVKLRDHLAHLLTATPIPVTDIIPHLLRLESETGRESVLTIFRLWNDPYLAQIVYDYMDDLYPRVRRLAVQLMGHWQDEKAVFMLFKKLSDPDESVRIVAVEALMQLKNPAIRSQLMKHMHDPSLQVEVKISWALAVFDDQAALPKIIEKMKNPEFRKVLLLHLSDKDQEQASVYFNYIGLDHRIIFNRYGRENLDHLYESFVMTAKESQDPMLRKKAIQALAIWKDKNIISLLDEISNSEPDDVNRALVKNLLANLKKEPKVK